MVTGKGSQEERLKYRIKQQLLVEKFNNPLGYVLLLVIGGLVSYVVGTQGFRSGIIFLSGILLLPTLLLSTLSVRFGVLCIVSISYFVFAFQRYMPNIEWSLGIDVLILCLLLGAIVSRTSLEKWRSHPFHIWVILWIAYCLLQVLNPMSISHMAWLYAFRALGVGLMLYFFAYKGIRTENYVRTLTYCLIILGCVCAVYGIKQIHWGLFQHEMRWLYAQPELYTSLMGLEQMRVFSFFKNPMVFGIVMALHVLICCIMMLEPNRSKRFRILMSLCAGLGMYAMLYSGTRAAYILLPMGLGLFAIMSLRRVAILLIILVFGMGFLFTKSFPASPISYRLAYVFQPQTYIEFLAEKNHKHTVQPLVRSLPLGMGIGSTGNLGKRFTKATQETVISPKDGYALLGLETGWLGVMLFLGLMFIVFKESLNSYFHSQAANIRHFYALYFVLLVSILIANLSHVLLNQMPFNLLMAVSLAVLARLKFIEHRSIEDKQDLP